MTTEHGERLEPSRVQMDTAVGDHGIAALPGLLDAMPGGVVVLAPDHRVLYANQAFVEQAIVPRGSVLGRHARDVVGEAADERLRALAARAREGREPVRWEGWSTRADGSRRYDAQAVVPLFADGEVAAVAVLSQDLTGLRERERALDERQAALAFNEALNTAIVASALDCIIVTDEEGRIIEFNPAAEATFGHPRASALGRLVGELIVPHVHRERHDTGMRRYLAGGASRVLGRRVELEAMHADGSLFPIELTLTEVRLPDRRLFTAHLRDLTAARAAQAQIMQQRDRLHQIEKLSAMGSLLAGVAHELNNPLAILLAQAALLQERATSDDIRRRADRMYAAAERSSRIVKSFLAMARQKPPRRERVDVNEVVAAAVEMLAYGMRSDGVALHVQAAPDLPPIEADRDLLGQVVANVLINAQQALAGREDPRIWVTTRAVREGVRIEIADNGPGVPPHLAERVFEPFFTTKAVGVGTGIGLSVCRSIVEAHGGRLSLEPRPGGGAAFQALLPVGAPAPEAGASAPTRAGGGLSVLVVDDEVEVGRSLAEILELLGHRARVVERVGAALEAIEREAFDLVFADLRMPDLGGLGLRDRLARERPGLAARMILMTGDTVAGVDAARAGPDGREAIVLEKPFTPADIRACLDKVLAAGPT